MRHLSLLLLASLLAASTAAAESFKVIKPSDEAHKLLPKTCEVCHKGESLQFFLVTSTDAKQLEEALRLLSTGARNLTVSAAAAPVNRDAPTNPHTSSNCLFCHVAQPLPGSPVSDMDFRTITGKTRGYENQEELCRLCHPNLNQSGHPKLYNTASKASPDLEAAGLKLGDGRIVCTTCHDMHDPLAVNDSIRPQLMEFFKNSRNAYPHARKYACLACHPTVQQAGTTPRFIEPDPVKMCARCHGTEHPAHRYGVVNTEKTYPMDFLSFPLAEDGKLTCTTCHDEPCLMKPQAKNPKMLRGGPYYRATEMCEKCHPKGGQLAVNPHNQVGPDGKTIASVCQFCHVTDPWGGEYGPGNMAYRDTPTELCLNCHKYKPHPDRDHLAEIDDKRLNNLHDYESRHKVKLPLAGANTISCYTCHNPHGKGVLSGAEALGAGEMKFLRIPSFAEVCTPCHKRYD